MFCLPEKWENPNMERIMEDNSDKICEACEVCGRNKIKNGSPKWTVKIKRTHKSRLLPERIFGKGETIYPVCRDCALFMMDNAIAENIGGKAYGDYIGDGKANGHGERKLGHCLSI